MGKPRIFILDFMSMAFRYHHAMNQRPLFTSAGFPTSALFGVVRALFAIVEREQPQYMLVACDTPEPTFRHKLYPDYKAHRTEMPPELSAQIPKLFELIEILGLPLIKYDSVEADDIMATLAQQALDEGFEVYLVTGDKDMMQLVESEVSMYQTLPFKNQIRIIGPAEVEEYFGVRPDQVVCAQSLIGDPTDGVPGVRGIGKVRAARLLKTYGSLERIYQHIDEVQPAGVQKKLMVGKDEAFLSRQLVTLKKDVSLGVNLADAEVQSSLWGPDNTLLDRFICQCEFHTFHRKHFPQSQLAAITPPLAPQGAEEHADLPGGDVDQAGEGSAELPGYAGVMGGRQGGQQRSLLAEAVPPRLRPHFTQLSCEGEDPLAELLAGEQKTPLPLSLSVIMPLRRGVHRVEGTSLGLVFTQLMLPPDTGDRDNTHKSREAQESPFPRLSSLSPQSRMVPSPPSDLSSSGLPLRQKGYYLLWGEAGVAGLSETFKEQLQEVLIRTPQMVTYDMKAVLHELYRLLGPRSQAADLIEHWDDVMIQGSLVDSLGGHPPFSALLSHSQSLPALGPALKALEVKITHAKTSRESLVDDELIEYFLWQSYLGAELYQRLSVLLEAMDMLALYERVERPLIRVLTSMERRGVYIDSEALGEFSTMLTARLDELGGRIHMLAGTTFNIQSPKQMSEVLYDQMQLHEKYKLTRLRKTSQGYSTRESTLLKMAAEPIIVEILEYRKIAKLKGTYADALPALIHPQSGRVHTTYLQNGTATGRMSSRDPNLQNIPVRSERGQEIRRAFCASGPDQIIISADYSQIELRVLAHMSGDERLCQAFRYDDDVHKTIAGMMMGKELCDVTDRDRSIAKGINYGMIYGMGPRKLAKVLGISLARARGLMEQYFETFSSVSEFMEGYVAQARQYGFTRTLYGRRRTIVEVHDRTAMVRAGAENASKNSPIQGSAADLMKLAMVEVFRRLEARNLAHTLLLQVHDELVFEVPRRSLDDALEAIRGGMEEVVAWQVPVVVSLGTGAHWLEAH